MAEPYKREDDPEMDKMLSSIKRAIENDRAGPILDEKQAEARVGNAFSGIRKPKQQIGKSPFAPRAPKEAVRAADEIDLEDVRNSEFAGLYEKLSRIGESRKPGFASIMGGQVEKNRPVNGTPPETSFFDDEFDFGGDDDERAEDIAETSANGQAEEWDATAKWPDNDDFSGYDNDWGYNEGDEPVDYSPVGVNGSEAQPLELELSELPDDDVSLAAYEESSENDDEFVHPDAMHLEADDATIEESIDELGNTFKAELDQIYKSYLNGRMSESAVHVSDWENPDPEYEGIDVIAETLGTTGETHDIKHAESAETGELSEAHEVTDKNASAKASDPQLNEESLSEVASLDIYALVNHNVRTVLTDWMDANLPGLVERVIREEIRRMMLKEKDVG